MKDDIYSFFSSNEIKNCTAQLNEKIFWIEDDTERNKAYLELKEIEGWHFKVENPKSKVLHFFAFDKCLFKDDSQKGQRRCDCGIFEENKYAFIELKDVKRKKQRRGARKSAAQQLKGTLSFFNFNSSVSSKELLAIIGMKDKHTKIVKTGTQREVAEFTELFNAKLVEGNTYNIED